jgi:hypothetical protein
MNQMFTLTARLFPVFSFFACATCFSQQLLLNGGFESGQLSPWYQARNFSAPEEGPENWNVISTDAHSGLYCATDIGNIELRQDFAPLSIASISQISLWVRQPNGPSLCSVYFHYSDLSEQFNRLDTHTTGWEFFDITSRLAPNKVLTGISFFGYSYGSPARTMIDDFVVAVPEPGPGPLAIAFVFVWLVVRKCCSRSERYAGL